MTRDMTCDLTCDLADTPYLAEGLVEPLGPGRCRVVVGAWSWAGLAASIARVDADIEVVEPPELVQAFAELGRRAATAGRGASPDSTTTGPPRRPPSGGWS